MQALLVLALLASDWPQFRGPAASGVAPDDAPLPVEFGPGKNVAWKTLLPPGHSSPVIWGDRILLTAVEGGARSTLAPGRVVDPGGKLLTICLDRKTGKVLWKVEAPRPRLEKYQPANSPASPTPVTDGKTVYVFFGDFGLLAYDLSGKLRWQLPLGPFNNPNGHGTSPVLAGDLLVQLCDQDSGSYLLAVDKSSGKVRWRVERPDVTRSYSTPGVWRDPQGKQQLIIPGSYRLDSYDAQTGAHLWWMTGLSWQPKSAPVVAGDTIYAHWWENGGESEQATETPEFSEPLAKYDRNGDRKLSKEELAPDERLSRGFGDNDMDADGFIDERDWNFLRARRAARNALIAIRPGDVRGELKPAHVMWRMQKYLPNMPTPLLYQGVLYLVKDGGILTALDPLTGAILKQARLPQALDTYYSSPVAGDGKVYTFSLPGKATVLRAGRDWEILSSVDFGEEISATPALLDGRMYVRTKSALYAFASAR